MVLLSEKERITFKVTSKADSQTLLKNVLSLPKITVDIRMIPVGTDMIFAKIMKMKEGREEKNNNEGDSELEFQEVLENLEPPLNKGQLRRNRK